MCCGVTGWGLRKVPCSGRDFSGIFGEGILHLSVLTPNAPRAGHVSLHPPPSLSPLRQELSAFVFLHDAEILLIAVTAGSPLSPLAGAAPPEAQLLGCCLGAAEQVTH